MTHTHENHTHSRLFPLNSRDAENPRAHSFIHSFNLTIRRPLPPVSSIRYQKAQKLYPSKPKKKMGAKKTKRMLLKRGVQPAGE
jgi:hypothetical protein